MENKNWKDTLLMPKTNFNMKANLVNKELEFQTMWIKKDIYNKSLNQNKKNQFFILHDGPPYANGPLHIGHALNKILKDIVVRYKTLNGFFSPYVPGWDTHGLPIENKMLEELHMTKDDLDKISLRKKAKKYALKQVELQKNQFKLLSLFTDMKDFYVTLNKQFEVGQLKLFKKMFFDNLIYKKLYPVYWSPSSGSALAEAEVEYKDIKTPQIIVALKITNNNKYVPKGTYLTIMTTTPWTLIANVAVVVGKNFDYDLIEHNNLKYVIASKLTSFIAKLSNWKEYHILKTIKGHNLIGLHYNRPIKNNLQGPILNGEHVVTDVGTGLVHTAPLFGKDDFEIGIKNNLDMIMHVNDDGTLNEHANEFKNLFYQDANKQIISFLNSKSLLLSLKFVKHSYPHDWRTHQPIIFRGTPQWFVSIKKIKSNILTELKKIHSYPEWGIVHLTKMIKKRHSWTISRQRTWGIPIIIFYDANKNIISNEEVFDYAINLIEKYGTDIWWQKSTDELLPKSFRNKGYTKELDIMDVWFDSGSSHIYMNNFLKNKYGIDVKGQFNLYFEGNDQYRGWFNSSLINAIAYRQKAPYKKLLSHGFVLDSKNQKMSKSKGNVIDPLVVIKKHGSDILRLWAANSEYTSNITISNEIILQTTLLYRNLRSKIRFMLANLFDFNELYKLTTTNFHALITEKLNNLKYFYQQKMDVYQFSVVIKEMNNFLLEVSGFYFDYAKNELYVGQANSIERRMFQTNMFEIVSFFIVALAPFLPVSMEDAYIHLPKKNKKESVHLETMNFLSLKVSNIETKKYANFLVFKDKVYKFLELARKKGIIKRANEAIVETNVLLQKLNIKDVIQLANMLMVAKIILLNETNQEIIRIKSFNSKKCSRCWNHFDKNILNSQNICKRCQFVINKK